MDNGEIGEGTNIYQSLCSSYSRCLVHTVIILFHREIVVLKAILCFNAKNIVNTQYIPNAETILLTKLLQGRYYYLHFMDETQEA